MTPSSVDLAVEGDERPGDGRARRASAAGATGRGRRRRRRARRRRPAARRGPRGRPRGRRRGSAAASASPLGRVGVEARPVVGDPAPRAAEDLAAVVLAALDDPRDLGERQVEGVAQHEHRALDRRQALEQQRGTRARRSPRPRPRAGASASTSGSGSHDADVGLAPHARRAQDVDRQPRRDRRQERALGFDRPGAAPAQVRLLHDVLGLGDDAEHPVGDREEQWAQLVAARCHSLTGRLVREAMHILIAGATGAAGRALIPT